MAPATYGIEALCAERKSWPMSVGIIARAMSGILADSRRTMFEGKAFHARVFACGCSPEKGSPGLSFFENGGSKLIA
jgi:hypothetical protein